MNKKKNKIEEETITPGKIVKVFSIVIGAFLVLYLVTSLFVVGDFSFKKDVEEVIPASIGYSKIIAGEIFNRVDSEYYVIIYNSESDNFDLMDYHMSYTFLPNIKMYKVDVSSSFSSYIKSEISNISANGLTDLRVSDVTLLRIKSGNNILSIEGIDKIKEYFE